MEENMFSIIFNITIVYSIVNVRGRADKFCLHLNRKWTGKDILMK